MVCSPEQSRANGKQSKGPTSQKGKRIAARNATKHGLLSHQPPLLATEDLEQFQDMMQELIDEYHPQTPTETLLIQQVAMGWLRLQRLWGAEAAAINLQALKLQKNAKYPTYPARDKSLNNLIDASLGKSFKQVLTVEKDVVIGLLHELNSALAQIPSNPALYPKWYLEVLEFLLSNRYQCPSELKTQSNINRFWLLQSEVREAFYMDNAYGHREKLLPLSEAKVKLLDLVEAAHIRLAEIRTTEDEIRAHNQAIAAAEIASQGVCQSQLFPRYEQHITKQLSEALDRLTILQEQRRNKGSIGSFGK